MGTPSGVRRTFESRAFAASINCIHGFRRRQRLKMKGISPPSAIYLLEKRKKKEDTVAHINMPSLYV
jgi:hypothetical protein